MISSFSGLKKINSKKHKKNPHRPEKAHDSLLDNAGSN